MYSVFRAGVQVIHIEHLRPGYCEAHESTTFLEQQFILHKLVTLCAVA